MPNIQSILTFVPRELFYFFGVCSDVTKRKDNIMLGWALTFLVVAIIAAVLGFGGIAVASAEIAKIVFVIFLVLFLISAIANAFRGKPPV